MVLVALAVPLGLVAFSRTRRFGAYMLIGMVVTALVVVGAAPGDLVDGAARPLISPGSALGCARPGYSS